MVSNETPLWVPIHITVIQRFHGIRVLKVFEDTFLNALQYHLTFLLKDNVKNALTFPLPRNLFSETCPPIEHGETGFSIRYDTFYKISSLRSFPQQKRLSILLCRTCMKITIINVTKNPQRYIVLLNCVNKASKEACPYYDPSMTRSPKWYFTFTVVN